MRSLPFRTPSEQAAAAGPAIDHLRAGGLIAYPTETVYGFGAALVDSALDRLAEFKGDRAEKSFLLIVGERAHAPGLHWTPAAEKLAGCFWPGPLTLALRCDSASYPARVVSAAGTVAVRWTSHQGMRRLLSRLGEPITSTSANQPGLAPSLTPASVRELVTRTGLAISLLLLDGGELAPSAPSTLVDCSAQVPRVLRAGAITFDELKRCVHDIQA
ncbi:MAG: L-threonylcarbamoyladenylate synthase [Pseudomonas sp.]